MKRTEMVIGTETFRPKDAFINLLKSCKEMGVCQIGKAYGPLVGRCDPTPWSSKDYTIYRPDSYYEEECDEDECVCYNTFSASSIKMYNEGVPAHTQIGKVIDNKDVEVAKIKYQTIQNVIKMYLDKGLEVPIQILEKL
jgi:hypothetical protein